MTTGLGMKNAKLYISVTASDGDTPEAQASVLANASAYDALDWQEVKYVGEIGEFGRTTEMASYNSLGESVGVKIKTTTDGGSPVVELMEVPTDKGQKAMTAAGASTFTAPVAIKVVYDDMPSGGTNGTTRYFRALVSGPVFPNGRIENFRLARFTLGITEQEYIEKAAA